MSLTILKEGGELNTTRIGEDRYEMKLSIPTDSDGRLGRECHTPGCSPAYFKVKPGTGIVEGHEVAYCPYCRHQDEPNNFYSSEQLRYAKDLALREVSDGVSQIFKEALGLGSSGKRTIGSGFISMEMSYQEGSKPHIRRPFEEDVRRDVICPNCGLDHSVYGLATWCADCGEDIFLTHMEAEVAVIRAMLSDVERRREQLGRRIAAKDIENCLEDTVSIFEAALRILAKRHLVSTGKNVDETDRFFKKIGNAFQNLKRSEEIFRQELDITLLDCLSEEEFKQLESAFDKRHPITHNLGVVDRKYLERARSAEDEGKEVLISVEEVETAIATSMKVFKHVHSALARHDLPARADASQEK